MKKIISGLLLVFTLLLCGCSGGKVAKNEKISDSKLQDIIQSIVTDSTFYYPEEDTFNADPNDPTYEIGYAFVYGRGFNYLYDTQQEGFEYDYDYYKSNSAVLEHRLIRRDVVSKTMDTSYFPTIEDNGKTWILESYKSENGKTYVSNLQIYSRFEVNGTTTYRNVEIDNKNFFEYFPFEISTIPSKNFKYSTDGESSSVLYKDENGTWLDIDKDCRSSLANKVDFCLVDYDGKLKVYISFETIWDLAMDAAKKK